MHMKTQAGIEETFCCVLYRFPFHSSSFPATNSAVPHFHLYSVLFNSKKVMLINNCTRASLWELLDSSFYVELDVSFCCFSLLMLLNRSACNNLEWLVCLMFPWLEWVHVQLHEMIGVRELLPWVMYEKVNGEPQARCLPGWSCAGNKWFL